MSFSSELKSELCKLHALGCCRLAECYGMLCINRSFALGAMAIVTENEDVAQKYAACVRGCFDVPTVIRQSGEKRGMYTVSVSGAVGRKKIINAFGANGLKRSVLLRECCINAFLRGAFLSCGQISNPQKEYRLEFIVADPQMASDLLQLLADCNLFPKALRRGGKTVLCFKESDQMEDVLTRIGAAQYTLQLMDIKIYKDMRNKINRINNCETANITKTVHAAVAQLNAIAALEATGELESLPEAVQAAAGLRKANPEASLSELCRLSPEPLSRSALNRRFEKLMAAAEAQKG